MTRRDLLGLAAAAAVPRRSILVHEHVLVDFIGADRIAPGRYDPEEVFRAAKARIDELKPFGCVRLQECTPAYIGRDPRLLRRLAETAGIEIWTNTGLYGAGNHKYVPRFAHEETAGQLARRWIAEYRRGVDGVKPRFIKSGVNKGPLGALDRKLVRAAAIASRETGLAAAIHTGDGPAFEDEAALFERERVPLSRLVWVHAQNEQDHSYHERAARAGAWVEFDGIGPKALDWHVECVRFMAGRGLLGRTLVSQDSGWYHAGEPGGGTYRGYTFLFTDFLPKLEPGWADRLLWRNPREAFG